MPSYTRTPGETPLAISPTPGPSAEQLFNVAFAVARDPRSPEYKAGVRAALHFRIDRAPIPLLYAAGTAQDDAFHAGIAEGHGIWRRALAESAGAA